MNSFESVGFFDDEHPFCAEPIDYAAESLSDEVDRLKYEGILHHEINIELAKLDAQKPDSDLHHILKRITKSQDEIAKIEAIDPSTIEDITLEQLRSKSLAASVEFNQTLRGTAITPPRPEVMKLLEEIQRRRKAPDNTPIVSYIVKDGVVYETVYGCSEHERESNPTDFQI